jgi:hypothetical protein
LATGGFYALLFYTPLRHSAISKYTAEHGTEYAITFLFLWWTADLARIVWGVLRDKRALRRSVLPARSGPQDPEEAAALLAAVEGAGHAYTDSMLGRRLRSALTFIVERRSAEGMDDYLRSLEERDAEEVDSSCAFRRSWAFWGPSSITAARSTA